MAEATNEPFDATKLLLSKKLEPLPADSMAKLQKIEKLNVSNFSEEDVRAAIINPILEVLGYEAGQIFSADHGHILNFLGKHRFPDYKMKLWNENFWVIEAKKPRIGAVEFGYAELAQAIEYAIHPEVNAALVVLCDGLKVEIFDREASVTEPAYRLEIAKLTQGFDQLRLFLEPMQVWFFQKRRILRMLDKVFDREFNMHRVEEFGQIVKNKLESKRQIVLENFRAAKLSDSDENLKRARAASLEDITEIYMFYENPVPIISATTTRLIELGNPNQFRVMHKVFGDTPGDSNDIYMGQALKYLLEMDRQNMDVNWMPSWLGTATADTSRRKIAIEKQLDHCLTYFEAFEPYRVILLAERAMRRLLKVLAISSDDVRRKGNDLFALARHELPEMSWAQIVATPGGQLLQEIDIHTRMFTRRFVRTYFGRQKSLIESAKQEIRTVWATELKALAAVSNYPALRKERSLGDMGMIEYSSVSYDNLAHCALCLMHGYDSWKAYLLNERRHFVEQAASMGSRAARAMLSIDQSTELKPMPDDWLANRFFFGDVETMRKLRAAYQV